MRVSRFTRGAPCSQRQQTLVCPDEVIPLLFFYVLAIFRNLSLQQICTLSQTDTTLAFVSLAPRPEGKDLSRNIQSCCGQIAFATDLGVIHSTVVMNEDVKVTDKQIFVRVKLCCRKCQGIWRDEYLTKWR